MSEQKKKTGEQIATNWIATLGSVFVAIALTGVALGAVRSEVPEVSSLVVGFIAGGALRPYIIQVQKETANWNFFV